MDACLHPCLAQAVTSQARCSHRSRVETMTVRADIQGMWRTWFKEPAVRATGVDHGYLIVTHEEATLTTNTNAVRACIKDCVRNKFVLAPTLSAISTAENYKLFHLKDAVREFFDYSLENVCF